MVSDKKIFEGSLANCFFSFNQNIDWFFISNQKVLIFFFNQKVPIFFLFLNKKYVFLFLFLLFARQCAFLTS